jgi:hypothetical protein
MTTYVSYTDSKGKLKCKQDPNQKYQIGKVFDIEEKWNLFVDNELMSVYVKKVEITDMDKEFVVNEESWYVTYEVTLYGRFDTEIKTEYHDQSDIEETLNV